MQVFAFAFFAITLVSMISANPFGQRGFGRHYDNENGMRPGFEYGMLPAGVDLENGMPGVETGFENGMISDNVMMPGFGRDFESRPNNGMTGGGLGYFGQFGNGKEYTGRRFNNGASGMETHGIHNAAGKHYHNIGSHHHHSKSIKEEDSDESHNIGGGVGFDNSAHSGGGFRNYQNGAEDYENQYANGAVGARI